MRLDARAAIETAVAMLAGVAVLVSLPLPRRWTFVRWRPLLEAGLTA